MEHTESLETINRFIEIDRNAGLGRLSRGIVHTLNNVMTAVLGQVDLLSLNPHSTPLQDDLKKILKSCEEGTGLMRNLTLVIHSLQGDESMDAGELTSAMLDVFERIFHRFEIPIDRHIPAQVGELNNTPGFAQAVFHTLQVGFYTERSGAAPNKRLACSIRCLPDGIKLDITTFSGRISVPDLEVIELSYPPAFDSVAYHLWIVDRVCRNFSRWEISDNLKSLSLSWFGINNREP